jgi:hypothetical protein
MVATRCFSSGWRGVFLALALATACCWQVRAALVNERYQAELLPNGNVRLVQGGAEIELAPAYMALFREDDPRLALRPGRVRGVSYAVETWFTGRPSDGPVGDPVDLARTVGDGWDPSILAGDQEGRTANLFEAAISRRVVATGAFEEDGEIRWTFPRGLGFEMSATLSLPPGDAEPALRIRFVPERAGWYSIGYLGAPSVGADETEELFQPPLWTRRRLPEQSYFTSAFRCTLPTAMVSAGGVTWGVAVDPSHLPFQPLPLLENSLFGVVLRNAEGRAQPMAFAPVLGGRGSRREAGQAMEFILRPFVAAGSLHGTYEHLARNLMQLRDHRTNAISTLNQSLENIVEYALTPYARFDEDLRGSSYETDVPGSVNNVTSLHPLSLAILMDEEEIYWRRAVPMLESGLSREKMLFTIDPKVTGQGASWKLTGPNIRGSDFAALYDFSGRRQPWLRELAEATPNAWLRNFALYRATGEQAFLTRALAGARSAVGDLRKNDSGELRRIGFWTTPWPWIALWDMYELSGDEFFRDAAVEGAREYTRFIWMGPTIPAGEITVNPGGTAPHYWYMRSKGKPPMKAPEARIPAWRASEIGLTSESAPTSGGHRAIFLAMPMTTMLRMGYATDDRFFHDLARSAIVGRSANFPGYHINTARTNVYEKADYPLRSPQELSYNSFHYNHVWPHAAMLVDYLVADAEGRSARRIQFPGHYAEGYGYLQLRVYGHAAGRFYDQPEAKLWLPRRTIALDNVEVNWLAARSEAGLCLALTNQSGEEQVVNVRLNQQRIEGLAGRRLEALVWSGADEAAPVVVEDGQFSVSIPPMGIVGLRIPGTRAAASFADRVGHGGDGPAGGYLDLDFAGGGRAYLHSLGEGLSHGYLFVRATRESVSEVRCQIKTDGRWVTQVDRAYPFEFSIRLKDGEPFEFRLEAVKRDGSVERSPVHRVGPGGR